MSPSTRRRLRAALPNLVLIVLMVMFALQGGWWLLALLPAVPAAIGIWRGPRPARQVPGQFAEPGGHRVVLQVPGPNAIAVIRELKRTTGLSLTAAKQLVDEAPVVVIEHLSESSAALIVEHLQKAGARAMAVPIGET